LHRFRAGRRAGQRISGTGAAPAGFGLLQEGVAPKDFRGGAVSGVCRTLFIIMRNTLRGARIERRRFES